VANDAVCCLVVGQLDTEVINPLLSVLGPLRLDDLLGLCQEVCEIHFRQLVLASLSNCVKH